LDTLLQANPNYGTSHGWAARDGEAFRKKLEATYIIRIYAEFEAALRSYWLNYLGKETQPGMYSLVNHAIPNQSFSQDVVDNADKVRRFRNFLVHDVEDDTNVYVEPCTVQEARSYLCKYISRLDAAWRYRGVRRETPDGGTRIGRIPMFASGL